MVRAQLLAMLVQLSFDPDRLLLTYGDDAEALGYRPHFFFPKFTELLTDFLPAAEELIESGEEEFSFLYAVDNTGAVKLDD